MTNYLVLTERVKNTIALGESDYREFKSAWQGRPSEKIPRSLKDIRDDIAEALVAFANAESGDLLVGVEDDGAITGVPHDEEKVSALLTNFQACIMPGQTLPLLHATKLIFEGKAVLFFSVGKGTTEVYQLSDGRCMTRKGKQTIPAVPQHIEFTRAEVRSREYDSEFVDAASLKDLNLKTVQAAANVYLPGLDAERYLQQIGLAEYSPGGLRLRRAALLLFADDISRWHRHSLVRVLRVNGSELQSGNDYNVTSDEPIIGNIPELIDRAWPSIRPLLTYRTEFGSDARFEQKYIYPEFACQEALVNAIAHRDYTTSSGVEVFIFDDRLEIRNPGALLSTLSLKDLVGLQGAHESRNSLIARVLRENFRVMRELGEGMRRIFQGMSDRELNKPILISGGNHFAVTLENKSSFSAQQQQWLHMFERFNVSPLQKRILIIGMGDREISPSEIYRAIGKDRDTYDKEVTGLRKRDLLVEIRTSSAAKQMADSKGVPKNSISRFRVHLPDSGGTVVGDINAVQLQRVTPRRNPRKRPQAIMNEPTAPLNRQDKVGLVRPLTPPPVRPAAIDLRGLNTWPEKKKGN